MGNETNKKKFIIFALLSPLFCIIGGIALLWSGLETSEKAIVTLAIVVIVGALISLGCFLYEIIKEKHR